MIGKPALHLNIGGQLSSERSSSRNDENNNEYNGNMSQQTNGLAPPLHLQDPYITSPSSLFPDIYRQFAEAAAAGSGPGGAFGGSEDGDDGNDNSGGDNDADSAFAWPSLSNSRDVSGVKEEGGVER